MPHNFNVRALLKMLPHIYLSVCHCDIQVSKVPATVKYIKIWKTVFQFGTNWLTLWKIKWEQLLPNYTWIFFICEVTYFYLLFVNIIIGTFAASFIFSSGTPFFGKMNGSTFVNKIIRSCSVKRSILAFKNWNSFMQYSFNTSFNAALNLLPVPFLRPPYFIPFGKLTVFYCFGKWVQL